MLNSKSRGPWETPFEECPYCGFEECQAEYCDVGVGLIQCSPYYCQVCFASEIGPYDKERVLTEMEKKTGWYEPHSPVSETANTFQGALVDMDTAKALYKLGLLDDNRNISSGLPASPVEGKTDRDDSMGFDAEG